MRRRVQLLVEQVTRSISRIYTNGQKAYQLYKRHLLPRTGRPAICLPSTSPANAQWTLDRLIDAWSVITEETIPWKK